MNERPWPRLHAEGSPPQPFLSPSRPAHFKAGAEDIVASTHRCQTLRARPSRPGPIRTINILHPHPLNHNNSSSSSHNSNNKLEITTPRPSRVIPTRSIAATTTFSAGSVWARLTSHAPAQIGSVGSRRSGKSDRKNCTTRTRRRKRPSIVCGW